MANKVLNIISALIILSSIGYILLNLSSTKSVLAISSIDSPFCNEFLTNAINGSYIKNTWVAYDINNDLLLEYFNYTKNTLLTGCDMRGAINLTNTEEGYKVYLKLGKINVCIPVLNQFLQVEYGTRNKKETSCVICSEGESQCLGFQPLKCVNGTWKNQSKEIGICNIKCLKDTECGYYQCIDYICSDQLIQNISVYMHILEEKKTEIKTLKEEIENLNIATNDRIDLINSLNLSLQEKISLISSLKLTLFERSNLINSLNLSLQEKESSILLLQLSEKEKKDIIDSLTQQINSLTLSLQEKATIIDDLTLSLQEKATIIDDLTLSLQEKATIIDGLKISLSQKENMISQLEGTIAEKVRIIEDLKKKERNNAILIGGIGVALGIVILFLNNRKQKLNISLFN